jgi:hypothetical protein
VGGHKPKQKEGGSIVVGGNIIIYYLPIRDHTLLEYRFQNDWIFDIFLLKSITLIQIGCHLDLKVSLSTKWLVSFIRYNKTVLKIFIHIL